MPAWKDGANSAADAARLAVSRSSRFRSSDTIPSLMAVMLAVPCVPKYCLAWRKTRVGAGNELRDQWLKLQRKGSTEALCILFVEDEPLIRLILAEELTDAGFEVCQAENGDEAVKLIRDSPIAFTLLITDIHMPGERDGVAVARLMHRQNPLFQ